MTAWITSAREILGRLRAGPVLEQLDRLSARQPARQGIAEIEPATF